MHLGLALERQGRARESADALRQATLLRPDYDEAYTALGRVYRVLDMLQEAAQAYRQLIRLRPTSPTGTPTSGP
jgi:Flp pilus assembly protein TadD